MQDFRTELTHKRKKIIEKRLKDKTVKGRQRTDLEKPLGKYRPPIAVPESNEISVEEAQQLVPPDYKVSLHKHQARWEFESTTDNKFYVSRSWGKYGFRGAVIVGAREVWKHYIGLHPNVSCPIQDLFLVGTAPGPATGSSGSSSSGNATAKANAKAKARV